jgi:hypothetical protein
MIIKQITIYNPTTTKRRFSLYLNSPKSKNYLIKSMILTPKCSYTISDSIVIEAWERIKLSNKVLQLSICGWRPTNYTPFII